MAAESSSKEQSKNPLSQLPIGTELTGVSIPSYDENLNLNAVFEATKIIKISEEELQATDLYILQLETAEKPRLTVQLKNSLVYPQTKSIQENESIKLSYGKHYLQGSAAIINLQEQTVIITGPGRSRLSVDDFSFQQKETPIRPSKEPKTDMKLTSINALTSVVAATSIYTTYADGSPKGLSLTKQQQLDSIVHNQEETIPALEANRKVAIDSLKDTSDKDYNHFLKNHLSEKQRLKLINSKKAKPQATPAQTEEPQQENLLDADIKEADIKEADININWDGDSFYSAKSGILTYLTNVKVREPRLSLDCSKSLQIHMQSEEEKTQKKGSPFKKLIASGAVVFTATQKDKKGKNTIINGKAEIVEFDYLTQTTILKGGKPSIKVTQGSTSMEQSCKTDNQWILIEKDGSYRIEGGGVTDIQGLDNLEKNK